MSILVLPCLSLPASQGSTDLREQTWENKARSSVNRWRLRHGGTATGPRSERIHGTARDSQITGVLLFSHNISSLFQAVKKGGTPSHCWGGCSTADLLIIFVQILCISLGAWEQICELCKPSHQKEVVLQYRHQNWHRNLLA